MPDYKVGLLGDYIAAEEFGGKRPTLTIESIRLETLEAEDGKSRDRWVVRFKGKSRGWVLNTTNCILLAAMYESRNTDEWIGRRVTLHAADTKVRGKPVQGIRVYGSPELKSPLPVEVQLPRRKPVTVTLQPTGDRCAE